MALVKRDVILGESQLCVILPDIPCRKILINEYFDFDPGIGQMVVNTTTSIAYFRVR